MKHSGKLIIITGATRGIGAALAHKLSALGHTVIGCGSSAQSVQAFNQRENVVTQITPVDISQEAGVQNWAQEVIGKYGPPDLLINNAGIINEHTTFASMAKATFDRVIDVNVKGTANVIRAFLPAMLPSKQGVIINITSGAGKQGYPEISAYCTSKFAVEGLSQSIAKELPEGMACIALSPGVINTEMLQQHWGEKAHECDTPEIWAEYAAPHILSLSSLHNGQSLRIEQASRH